ncbi:MAG: DUF1566 domain-containing protein [Desulfobulbaceae bacterium]|nr:DUF1566 domain-containing protein [Desulfobulbaceae bacterium]
MIPRGLFYLFFSIVALLQPIFAYSAQEEPLCDIVAPGKLEKFSTIPVKLIVDFSSQAESSGFMAILNGRNVTRYFETAGNSVRAKVGPEEGLLINLRRQPTGKVNTLKILVRKKGEKKYRNYRVHFFAEVDELKYIGRAGGSLYSPDDRFVITVPPNALQKTTAIALSAKNVNSVLGGVYRLSPQGTEFSMPFTISFRYDRSRLPPGAREDELFMLTDQELTRKVSNTRQNVTRQLFTGESRVLSSFFLSYYKKIGKKISDIPFTESFRSPIGDVSSPYYGCGSPYTPPSSDDFGEAVRFLNVAAGPDGPVVSFNQHDPRNSWQVVTGFKQLRRPGYFFEFPQNVDFFNTGEDWYFLGNQEKAGNRLPIHAVADGLVISSSKSYGNNVVLAHRTAGGLIFSVYSMLEEQSLCSEGTIMRKGNVIGMIHGKDGGFPNFHFEIAKQAMVILDDTGEISIPAHWYGLWGPEEIASYYNPTLFLLNYQNKRKWRFDTEDNPDGWVALNTMQQDDRETEQISGGGFKAKPGKDFRLASYPLHIKAENYDSVFVKMKSVGLAEEAKVYFTNNHSPRYSQRKTVPFVIKSDNEFHEYKVEMGKNPHWKDVITGLRLEYTKDEDVNDPQVELDVIRFGHTVISPVPDSGQDKCYDGMERISCPTSREEYYGQDANFIINPPLYTEEEVMGTVLVKDQRTGLQWHKQQLADPMPWNEAQRYCEELQLGEADDWRLPTRQELQTIVNYSCMEFGLNKDERPECFAHPADENVCYWTATTVAAVDPFAVKICFSSNKAEMADKEETLYVMPVRGDPLIRGQFVDNKDNTVTDLATDLMWMGDEAKSMTWKDSLKYCNNTRVGGYDDWRLPSVKELASLVDETKHEPSIDSDAFIGARSAPYWSSTTNQKYFDFAWVIDFANGFEYGGQKDRRYFVRPVRGASDDIVFFSSDKVKPLDIVPPAHLADDEADDEGDEEVDEGDEDEGDEDEGEDEDFGWGDEDQADEAGDGDTAGEDEGWGDFGDDEQPDDVDKPEKVDETEDDGWGDFGDDAQPDKEDKPKKAKKAADDDDGWGDWGEEDSGDTKADKADKPKKAKKAADDDDGWGDWGEEDSGDTKADKTDKPKKTKKSKKSKKPKKSKKVDDDDDWGDWGDEDQKEDEDDDDDDIDYEDRKIYYEPRPMSG